MDINTLTAANAYRNQLKMMQGAESEPQEQGGPSFSQTMKSMVQNAIDTQHKAESMQLQSLTGKVELSDLVTAVSDAELTLSTVVAIRDRVINAYMDITRMPI